MEAYWLVDSSWNFARRPPWGTGNGLYSISPCEPTTSHLQNEKEKKIGGKEWEDLLILIGYTLVFVVMSGDLYLKVYIYFKSS